jgi:hypothetical protein
MNKREKNLAWLLGSMAAVLICWKVVLPTLISPMVELGSKVRQAQTEQERLAIELEEVENHVRDRYHSYVLRNTGTNPDAVQSVFIDSLDGVLKDAKFVNKQTNPKNPSIDRKTDVATVRASVTATGSIAQCLQFIHGFYELPFVARITSIKLTPTPANQKVDHDEVRMNVEAEALVLPYDERFGKPDFSQQIPAGHLVQADLPELSKWRPFSEYRKPETIVRTDPTPTPGPPTPSPTPRIPTVPMDANGHEIVLRACSGYGINEVLLVNVGTNVREYVPVGGNMDGGELVLVDAWGAVVHKAIEDKDFGYYVYPIGDYLASAIKLEEAATNPELQFKMRRYLAQRDLAEREREERELLEDKQWEWAAGDRTAPLDDAEHEVPGPRDDREGWMLEEHPWQPVLPSGETTNSPATAAPKEAGAVSAPAKEKSPRPMGPFDHGRLNLPSKNRSDTAAERARRAAAARARTVRPADRGAVQEGEPVHPIENGPTDTKSDVKRPEGRGGDSSVSASPGPDAKQKRNDKNDAD